MAKRPLDIPNLSDDDLRQRLQPLADKVLPSKAPASAAPVIAKKARRKGMEFLLPEAVCREIKQRAAQRDISATKLLLEILRDAGYPVEPSDFIDMRKLPRKAG